MRQYCALFFAYLLLSCHFWICSTQSNLDSVHGVDVLYITADTYDSVGIHLLAESLEMAGRKAHAMLIFNSWSSGCLLLAPVPSTTTTERERGEFQYMQDDMRFG